MKELFIDSSSRTLILALKSDDQALRSFTFENAAENILSGIQRLVQLSHIDSIYFSQGPGGFTSLRIGAAVAKTISYVFGQPIYPLSSLRVLQLSSGLTGLSLCLSLARKNEFYAALFSDSDTLIEGVLLDESNRFDFFKGLENQPVNLISNSKDALEFSENFSFLDLHLTEINAEGLVKAKQFAGQPQNGIDFNVLYLRNNIASTPS